MREPGGTAVGERVRDLLKDPAVDLAPEAEALLFAAARAELVADVIRPALEEGRVVVSDRFLDSSLAYQGGARGLGVDEVERVNQFATGGLVPDITFLLDLAGRGRGRARRRERPLRGRGRGAPGGGARQLRAAAGAPTRPLAPDRRRPPARGRARRRAGRGGGRAKRMPGMTSPLAGTEDHPRRAWCWPPALERRALARLPVPRPGGHGQAHRGAGLRGGAAGRGLGRSRTRAARVGHGAHPDLTWVRPTGAHVMRVEDVEGPVVSAATRTPFESRRRVFVLERVDTMNDEVANRLLKTLEEPAHFVHLILLTEALGRVLETVISRCQLVRFDPLPAATIAAQLAAEGVPAERRRGMRAAGARERDPGALPGVRGGRGAARARWSASWPRRSPAARRRAPIRGARCSRGPSARGRAPRRRSRPSAKRRLELEPKGRERKAIEKEFEEAAKRDGRRARTGVAGPGSDPGRADLPRPGLPGRGGAGGGAGRRTAPPRWRSRPAAATRGGCARRPSAARRCARRWS